MNVDEVVRRAADRLAARAITRRALLAEAAVGGAGIAIVGCGGGGGKNGERPSSAATREDVPKACGLSRGRIHVCYEPWRVVRSEPAELLPDGYEGVAVRKGPEPDAPIIYKNGDPCVIRVGGVFGRQSRRQSDTTGGVRNDCPAPPMRAGRGAGRGFLWGYPGPRRDSGTWNKGGWIAQTVDGVEYSERWADYHRAICGPADLDFDCRAGDDPDSRWKRDCRKLAYPDDPGFKCNGGETRLGNCPDPRVYRVGIQENIDDHPLLHDLSHERYNLKYQADSTTIFWLVPGDTVRRHCFKCTLYNPSPDCPLETIDRNSDSCCRAYSCVTVVRARYCPAGVTGWVNSSVLRSRTRAAREIERALKVTGGDFNGF